MKRAAKKCVKAWKWSVATVPPIERMVLPRELRWSVLKQVENRTWGFCLQQCRPAVKTVFLPWCGTTTKACKALDAGKGLGLTLQ